jgi:D-psicose/D-tagatose/L-ribulose 3-epimerase
MKFGINTFLWGANFGPSDFHRLPRLKEAGFDGIEVGLLDPASFPAATVRRELEQVGLECTAVAIIPAGMGLGSPDASLRSKAQSHVRSCIRTAAEAGARLLSGPMYSPVGYLTGRRRTSEEWKWAVDSWRQLGDTVSDAAVEIGIEPLNRFETYFLNTTAEGAAFCDAIGHPGIGLLVDTFHANIEEKTIGEALRQAAPHLKHIHSCENDRGIPGSGHVAWDEFFAALRQIGYDRWLTIESFGFSLGELSAAASIWRDLAPNPEDIAFDGVKFLRRHASDRDSRGPDLATPRG